ncbi:MAG: hypothetical protein OXN95_01585 [bacterium]|nr:hypothetical protein [bacterium]
MALKFDKWSGRLADRGDPTNPPVIELPIKPSPRGGSGTFLAADDAGYQWWVKPLNNKQGERVTITEAIVATAGELVGAPVCETAIVFLPPEIEGWEFRPGFRIESGFAHASRAITSAVEHRSLQYRDKDENAQRHVGAFAIYDWCWGGDDQWLYAEPEDRKLYSHDHGWYLPETGPTWSIETLIARVSEPHLPNWTRGGLDPTEIAAYAQRFRSLSHDELVAALQAIPACWPVDDEELERVGWFLESRAPEVAARLVNMGEMP